MLPDDDSYRQVRKFRSRELLLGALLGFCALGSSVLYLVFLREQLALPLLITLIVTEWLTIIGVYLIIVSKMRQRR